VEGRTGTANDLKSGGKNAASPADSILKSAASDVQCSAEDARERDANARGQTSSDLKSTAADGIDSLASTASEGNDSIKWVASYT
jgi:hypothetical protein